MARLLDSIISLKAVPEVTDDVKAIVKIIEPTVTLPSSFEKEVSTVAKSIMDSHSDRGEKLSKFNGMIKLIDAVRSGDDPDLSKAWFMRHLKPIDDIGDITSDYINLLCERTLQDLEIHRVLKGSLPISIRRSHSKLSFMAGSKI